MTWPIQLIFFSVVMLFIWAALFRWSYKRISFAQYIILGNFIFYLFYTLLLFRPLFIEDLGRGGGAFSAGMMIMIFAPIHLIVVYLVVLLFSKTEDEGRLSKVLRNVGLPITGILLGYLISEKQKEISSLESQRYYDELNQRSEIEALENRKAHQEFEAFLSRFTADSSFQLTHINLPVPIFYLDDSLQVDSVKHYYKHQWPYDLIGLDYKVEILNNWEFHNEKTNEKVMRVRNQNGWTEYNFRFRDDKWLLWEIKK